MTNLILLVFDEADLASLQAAAASMKSAGVENLWVLHNPQLGLPNPPQADELAKRITEAQAAERQAGVRRDYTSATQYRDMANGLEVERGIAIKNFYKSIDDEQRQAAYDGAFSAINSESTGAKNILIEAIPDPLNKDQAYSFLAAQAASNWVDQFPHGNYVIAWVQAFKGTFEIPTRIKAPAPKAVPAPTPTPTPKPAVSKPKPEEHTGPHTAESLEDVPFFSLRKLGADLEIPGANKMNKLELIPAILSKQSLDQL